MFAQFVKLQSINLCANLAGQIACYLMVSPPEPGDASYDLYLKEKTLILNDLKEKAQIIGSELNNIDGLSVNIPEGAMYAFVKIELPAAHINRNAESAIDEKYCMALLEDTGICVVPGSGFGQFPNTLHFRTTFLPPREQIIELVEQLRVFHKKYLEQL